MKPNLEADFMRWHHAGAEFYNSGVRLLASLGIAAARGFIRACEEVYKCHPKPKAKKVSSKEVASPLRIEERTLRYQVQPGFRRAKV